MSAYSYPYQQPYAPQYVAPYWQQPYQQPVVPTPYQAAQNVSPVQQPVAAVPSTTSTIIWVRSYDEASNYPVAPNAAVQLWDANNPVVYLKQADASGRPTLKTYDLVERAEGASTVSNAGEGKQDAYATKDELAAVVGAVQGFDGALNAIRGDIDTIKGDMYGIAGKKKAQKKAEEGEE